jgi:hypothetical protein
MTFTPSSWNVGQSITVVARDDWIREGNHSGLVTMAVSSSDGRFDGITVDPVTVMIKDKHLSQDVCLKEAEGRAKTVRSTQRSSNTLYCLVNVRVNDG